MMLSSLLMLVFAIILYNIFNEVKSAGLPNQMLTKGALTENKIEAGMNNVEHVKSYDKQIEALTQVVNKIDNSIQNLQEKSHTWAIFHHHIESWNDGIRILENKLDLLKRTQEEQQQQLNKFDVNDDHHQQLFDEVKQLLNYERTVKIDISSKLNKILNYVETGVIGKGVNEKHQHSKVGNLMTPIGGVGSVSNLSLNKLEQRLNTISHQMAQQKDLKQLNSLEKRNSKSLETIHQSWRNHLDKQEEITTRLKNSNECCHALSSELTTFTESSDILLKRIEKLVRNVSEKLNEMDITTYNIENNIDEDKEENELREDNNETEENTELETKEHKEVAYEDDGEDRNVSASDNIRVHEHEHAEILEDNIHEVEFIRPYLSGCHELPLDETDLQDDTARIDGIYKFLSPEINDAERDFYERFCVFPSDDLGVSWTVIQHRGPYQQQENFNRSWSEYRNGFGHLSRDFWFGNEYIHRLVYHDDYELRIELEDFNGTQKWAEYAIFRVDSEKYNYNLLIGDYRGILKDAMKYHNDNDFSTYDRRNDKTVDACCSCALGYASGWWFDNCSEANLNGVYHNTPLGHNYIGIMWELWHGDYSLKKTRMMIRPRHWNITLTKHTEVYREYTEDP